MKIRTQFKICIFKHIHSDTEKIQTLKILLTHFNFYFCCFDLNNRLKFSLLLQRNCRVQKKNNNKIKHDYGDGKVSDMQQVKRSNWNLQEENKGRKYPYKFNARQIMLRNQRGLNGHNTKK